jgi:alpha-glucosidase
MRTTDPARIEDVRDPIGKLGWPKEKGRDGERTPMQWDASKEAGFTTSTKPWLPVPSLAEKYNVEKEKQDPDSIWNTYKRLLSLRKSEPAFRDGSYTAINQDDPDVFAFLRKSGGSTVLVVLNMSAKLRTISTKISNPGETHGELLYASPATNEKMLPLDHLVLEPFGVLIARVR